MVRPEYTDGHGGNGISYTPANYKYVVVFIHGLGDSARGWNDIAMMLQRRQGVFLETRFILPTAPMRPITMNGGMPMNAWSDIRELSADCPEDEEGLYESQKRILDIIDAEVAKGIASQHIVVGGFSQGGAVAYLTGLTYPKRLGAVVALSSWMPLIPDGRPAAATATKPIAISEAARGTPVMHCHGTMDPLVRTSWGLEAVKWLKETQKMNVTLKTYPMGHSAMEEELIHVGDFIQDQLEASAPSSEGPSTTGESE